MKKNKKKIITALSVLLIATVTVCAVFFIRTYDFGLEATEFELQNVKGGICITWDETEGANGYYIYRSHNGEKEKITEVTDGNTFCDGTVENAAEYVYSVVAFSTSGKSLHKNEKTFICVDAPSMAGYDNTVDGVVVKWKAVEKAEGYSVYRWVDGAQWSKPIAQVKGNATEYCDNSVVIADAYCYTVTASIGGFESGTDGEVKIDFIPAPENVKAENTVEGVRITWDKVSTVEGYEVYRRQGENGEWERIAAIPDCNTTQLSDSNVKDRALYEYRVNTYAGKLRSNYNQSVTRNLFIAPTVVSGVELRENGFKVSWYKTSSVDGYIISRKTEGESIWVPIGVTADGNQGAYTDTTAESGKRYSYTVSQVIGNYASAYVENDKNHLFIATPVLKVKNSPAGVRLDWTKAEGATEYHIFRKMSGEEEWTQIDAAEGDSTVKYIDKTVAYGKKASYKIKAWVDDKNESLVRKSVSLYAIDPDKPMVALTYDDGPYRPVTNSIIKTLKKHNARATFFIVGSRIPEFKDCLKKADKAGCEIANHTYEHTILTKATKNVIQSEISRTNKAVEAVTGKTPTLVRAPGGAVDGKVKKYVEYPLINWSVDTLDWKYRNASSVISKAKSGVKDGAIILMHDLYKSTAEASKTIIPWLIEEGYQLVTVSEMMDAKGISIRKGELYTKAEKA